LSTQVLSRESVELTTWVRFLRAHAAIVRRLNADLVAAHGLTLNDYEVLLHLAHAPERVLRRVDLADRVLLSASGITRLLDGLEGSGLVARATCKSDGRVVYAELTDQGYEKLREASETHLAGVGSLFIERFTRPEVETLAGLLGQLPGNAEAAVPCTAD
jgi:DNA-binding MarR family transcriptional regulator